MNGKERREKSVERPEKVEEEIFGKEDLFYIYIYIYVCVCVCVCVY